jgi:hypothetical protein
MITSKLLQGNEIIIGNVIVPADFSIIEIIVLDIE